MHLLKRARIHPLASRPCAATKFCTGLRGIERAYLGLSMCSRGAWGSRSKSHYTTINLFLAAVVPQSRYQCIIVLPFRMDSKRPTALLIWHMSPLCMKPVLAPVDEPKWNWQLSVMARLTSNSLKSLVVSAKVVPPTRRSSSIWFFFRFQSSRAFCTGPRVPERISTEFLKARTSQVWEKSTPSVSDSESMSIR